MLRHARVFCELGQKLMDGAEDPSYLTRVIGMLVRFTQVDVAKIGEVVQNRQDIGFTGAEPEEDR